MKGKTMAQKYYGSLPELKGDIELNTEVEEGLYEFPEEEKKKYNSTTRVGGVKKFSSPYDLKQAINQYFEDCEACEPAVDADGNTMLYKGEIVYLKPPTPPTTTGLALALGFPNRQSLVDFVRNDVLSQENDQRSTTVEEMGNPKFNRPEYKNLIKQAYAVCENFMEKNLYNKDTATGAKFALANSDKRWSDKAALDLTLKGPEEKISADEAVKRLQALGFVKTRREKKEKKGK